ncbi:MAG: sugar phosphate isomerase/epimerase [Candidatus Sumerlaeales bacterium]|nr:sugar phosphate isomerase/epimerase [Candidatus Sumerlaeales bacterium]
MKKEQIALQLYSIRKQCEQNLAQTLKTVSDIGIKRLELAGLNNHTAEDFRNIIDSFGQVAIAAHISLDDLLYKYEQTVSDYKTLGTKYLIVPWINPEQSATALLCQKNAEIMMLLNEKLARDGFALGFHNHWIEFDPHFEDGSYPWTIYTKTGIVAELDIAWCHRGKHLATEEIAKLPNTCKLLHVKDISFSDLKAQVVGEGDLNWSEIISCADSNNVEYFVIEVESWDDDRLGGVIRSYTNLLKYVS